MLRKFVQDFAPNAEARETLLGNLGDIVKVQSYNRHSPWATQPAYAT